MLFIFEIIPDIGKRLFEERWEKKFGKSYNHNEHKYYLLKNKIEGDNCRGLDCKVSSTDDSDADVVNVVLDNNITDWQKYQKNIRRNENYKLEIGEEGPFNVKSTKSKMKLKLTGGSWSGFKYGDQNVEAKLLIPSKIWKITVASSQKWKLNTIESDFETWDTSVLVQILTDERNSFVNQDEKNVVKSLSKTRNNEAHSTTSKRTKQQFDKIVNLCKKALELVNDANGADIKSRIARYESDKFKLDIEFEKEYDQLIGELRGVSIKNKKLIEDYKELEDCYSKLQEELSKNNEENPDLIQLIKKYKDLEARYSKLQREQSKKDGIAESSLAIVEKRKDDSDEGAVATYFNSAKKRANNTTTIISNSIFGKLRELSKKIKSSVAVQKNIATVKSLSRMSKDAIGQNEAHIESTAITTGGTSNHQLKKMNHADDGSTSLMRQGENNHQMNWASGGGMAIAGMDTKEATDELKEAGEIQEQVSKNKVAKLKQETTIQQKIQEAEAETKKTNDQRKKIRSSTAKEVVEDLFTYKRAKEQNKIKLWWDSHKDWWKNDQLESIKATRTELNKQMDNMDETNKAYALLEEAFDHLYVKLSVILEVDQPKGEIQNM